MNVVSAECSVELASCTPSGFRHKLRPLHQDMFYFPGSCGTLTPEQRTEVYANFLTLLLLFGCENCEMEDVFLQCP